MALTSKVTFNITITVRLIKKACKLQLENALAYLYGASMTKKYFYKFYLIGRESKSQPSYTSGANVIKLFLSMIYGFSY